jgi:predicted nucleotidyltransferase
LSSVRIVTVNEPAVRNALELLADRLKRRPEVLAVYLCGSWAKGNYTPYSDIDLLILVEDDDRMPHDRVPDYLPDQFPIGVDLFVYTSEELKKSRFAQELLREAVRL